MKKAMIYTGQGIFTGAMTTAGAFLAMALTNFKGIQEMGIICGGGMVVCFIPMMTLLPVLLFRGRQNVIDHQLPQKPDIRSRIENLWLHRPITVTAVTVILCALSLTQFRKIYFDYDLLHMQSRALPAVVFEEKLVSSGSNSVIFGVVLATNAEQAIQLEKRIRQLPAVADVRSMAPRVTGDQSKQLELIGEIKKEISPICFKLPDPAPVRLSDLSITLYGTYGLMGQIADHVDSTNVDLINQILGLRNSIGELRIEMLKGDREANSEKLGIFQRALFTDVHDTFENLRGQDNGSPLRAADLPPALHNRYIGVTGKFLLEILPKNDIWQRGYQEEYVKELRDVDPNVTGTPVQLYEYTTLLKDSYQQAARYALVAIIIMVFAHFRTVSSVILALLPVAIGSIWLGGMMGYFNIPFNPANIMTLPLVIGIGVTNGIHILNRFAEEKNPGILSKSTGKAVFVSGLTAIAGFGSLMLAKHQGIQTLGYVMSLGVATCMIAALTFLPALLNYLHSSRDPKTKQPSGDNARSTLGREELRSKTPSLRID
jgi:predicted RND superfamily exporter protein